MFTGFLFCGDCGEPMIRRINRYNGTEKVYFICPTRNKGLGCTRHSIPEEELKHLVLAGLQQQLALFLDKSHVLTQIETMEVQFDEVAAFDKEIRKLHQEQEKYVSLRSGLYEDLKQESSRRKISGISGRYTKNSIRRQRMQSGSRRRQLRICLRQGCLRGQIWKR